MPTVITVEQQSQTNSSSRSNSFTDEGSSTGTGVHVSHTSGSQEDSDLLDDQSWDPLYPDEIEPSESASRPRPSQYRRPQSRQPPPHRAPVRRHPTAERPTNRPPVSRVHRHAAPNPPSSVDPLEEYPGYGRGYPPHPGPYGGRVPPPGYAPSFVSGYSPNPFSANAGQMIPFGGPGPYQYPQNPFSPAPAAGGQGYFPPPHSQIPAHGTSGYSGHEMMPYGQPPGYGGPGGYGIASPAQMSFYPQFIQSPPPEPAPAPQTDPEVEKKLADLEKLIQDAKLDAEFTRKVTEAKVAAEKQAAAEAAAKAETDKLIAEQVAKVRKEADEKTKKAEEARSKAEAEAKAAAEAKDKAEAGAKAADEAKAKAEADAKKSDEAKTKAEADAKSADEAKAKAQAEAKALAAPPKEDKKKPIKFKDAVGRKFSFPFHLCRTWAGMEELIKQAFLHVEVIGPHVAEGHYDLVGPNGEIILPKVWETMIEPDWAITMHMWPMPEPPKPAPEGVTVIDVDPTNRPQSSGRPRHRADRPLQPPPPQGGRRGPPPPPPQWAVPQSGAVAGPGPADEIIMIEDNTPKVPKKSKKDTGGLMGALFFGGGGSKPSKSSGKGRPKKN